MLALRRLGGGRTSRTAAALLAVGLTGALLVGGLADGARADDDVPSQQDVADAQSAAEDTARTVAAVETDLALANEELRRTAVAAGQAAEAYNGARYHLRLARQQVALAERRATTAQAHLDRRRTAYAAVLTANYQLSPELSALSAIVESDGFSDMVDQTYTMQNAQDALRAQYDSFRAAATLADVATAQADQARTAAAEAKEAAGTARDEARAAQVAALVNADQVATRKTSLIAELALLQGVSVSLAEQRQEALEHAAAEAAASAAQQSTSQESQTGTSGSQPGPGNGGTAPGDSTPNPTPDPTPDPTPEPAPVPAPDPTPDPAPEPAPAPTPPAPSSGASSAIAFARAQLGEPYRWGAAGPNSWDCSGLTMGAWRAGGKSLPHYSVAQYQQSTPISASALRPGDLVFWGSSSRSSSIYHVALYVGDGQIIHAPRTGRPVSQESMYYWITPNFYARP